MIHTLSSHLPAPQQLDQLMQCTALMNLSWTASQPALTFSWCGR